MIEVCESMRHMETLSEKVESRWKQIVTVLTMEVIPPDRIGFLVAEMDAAGAGAGGALGVPEGRGC